MTDSVQFNTRARVLLIVCTMLMLAVAAETYWLQTPAVADDSQMPSAAGRVDSDLGGLPTGMKEPRPRPIQDFSEAVERPLFQVGRREVVVVAPPDPEAAPEASIARHWKLTGVVMDAGQRYALFEGQRDRTTVQLEEGMQLGGWQLERILADRVRLASGTRTVELALDRKPDKENKRAR